MSGRNAPDPFSAPRRPASLGKYRLLKKIGAGGMAEIWVASVAGISGVRKVCVIKQILPHLADSPEFVRMFLDEARIAATLDHPNLVQMYDIEEVAGVPVIAMEYLHGEDLRTVKKTLRSANRRMPLEHAVGITMGVAAGLHYAHEKVGFDGKPLNIVHRDVSPHNVFITYDGAVKILDFGIAKAANRVNETRDGALKGKVPYMSPEQCKSEQLDRRTDIYSAGILLYEMSTGSRLFRRGATEFELMRAIVEDPVMPPSLVMSDYPPALERIVLKCLAQDRAQRYATARELLVDLEAFAREERLATSALALSSFMSELFGKRAEAWRGAFSSEAELLSHIAEKQESDVQSDDSGSGELHGRAHVTPPPASAGPRGGAATKLSPSHAPPPLEPAPDAAAPPPRSDKVPSAAGAAEPGEPPGPRSLTVTKRRLGSLMIVSLSGRMTEQLQGLMVAKGITGRVLFDLGGVQRVTSFGVREWLVMLGEVSQNTSELYIGRCTEPIVNQVSMIRRFFGDGRIVSFYGPYRCERCGNAFERLFDCDRDAQILRACDPPSSPCPRCGAAAVFDDDAESYFAFAAAHAGVQLPADVRAALDELAKLDEGGQETIEKTVDERGTRIRMRCKLDAHVRWRRAFDGIEGDLVLELTGAGEVSPEGARALELALRALGDEVRSIAIEGCPAALLEHLAAVRPPLRATIGSALVDGVCERCNAPRQTLLDVREAIVAALDDREPYMPCKRCNAPLSFLALRPVLKRMGAAAEARGELPRRSTSSASRSILPAPEAPASSRARGSALLLPAPSATGGGGVGWPVAIALGAGLLLLGASIVARDSAGSRGSTDPAAPAGPPEPVAASELKARGAPQPGAPQPGAPQPGAPQPGAPQPGAPQPGAPQREDRPAWVQQPFVLEGDAIFVVGEGAGESREVALSVARADAISRLASNVVPALAGSAAYGFIQARSGGERRAGMAEAEASRYLKQVGAFATPERVDARFQERGGQVLAVARYRMRKQDFDAAVESYRRTVSVLGLTAAPVFPLLEGELRTSGDAVVVALESAGPAESAGIRVGDVVVAVNGRPLMTFDALPRVVQSVSAAGEVELTVEAGGERRTVTIERPPGVP